MRTLSHTEKLKELLTKVYQDANNGAGIDEVLSLMQKELTQMQEN